MQERECEIKMNLYVFARSVAKLYMQLSFKIEVIGTENIPNDQGVLICSNHIHNFDPPLVGITSPRPIHFMAKEELFNVPILKNLLPNINAFPIKRGMSDRNALRTALQVLKDKKVLGMFPEGTRSKTGELQKGLAGAGFIALKSDAAIVPVAIIGSYQAFKKIKIVYGKPLNFQEYRERKVSAEEATEIIMNEIQRLIIEYK